MGGPRLSSSPSLSKDTCLGNGLGNGAVSFPDDTVAFCLALCLFGFGLVAGDAGEAALAAFAGDLPRPPFFLGGMMNDCPVPVFVGSPAQRYLTSDRWSTCVIGFYTMQAVTSPASDRSATAAKSNQSESVL